MARSVREPQPGDAHAIAALLGELGYPSSAQDVMQRIESLVVTADARATGAGRLLVEAAEELARGWDCDGIEVTSSRHRHRTHAFYRRLGFADLCHRSGRFWKPL